MGYTSYSVDNRLYRSKTLNYSNASVDTLFTQNVQRKAHESMLPINAGIRECRDSVAHPRTIPIILGLDVTGSMRKIPESLIREGLPKMMSKLNQNGADDASLLFLAIGDHIHDNFPLQVGQFESGDEELDMWLTRSYLEGNGGGNREESYLLAYYFAAFHTSIDAFDRWGKKGTLITVGDEPCVKSLSKSAIKEIFGDNVDKSYSFEELYEKASEKYDIYHIHVIHTSQISQTGWKFWKEAIDEKCIIINDYTLVPDKVADLVIGNISTETEIRTEPSKKEEEEVFL